jgi:outer membrane protein assembly factor BamB
VDTTNFTRYLHGVNGTEGRLLWSIHVNSSSYTMYNQPSVVVDAAGVAHAFLNETYGVSINPQGHIMFQYTPPQNYIFATAPIIDNYGALYIHTTNYSGGRSFPALAVYASTMHMDETE